MSVALSFLGTEWTSPDHAIGFGTAITNPSTALSSMITGQLYYQEGSGDIDIIFLNAEGYYISLYKSFVNQKLLNQFVVRMTSISGQNKLRWIHRSLATTFTTEEALRACGVDVTVSDNLSGTMVAINTALAPLWISIYKA
jgi:hypothetical protein